jgi:glyoxylase-like metal-dependent hydrolase (beta-lactamase superfamily II)
VTDQVRDGWEAEIGSTKVEAVGLPGHTPGSTGYCGDGVIFTGDAMFAGSLGGAQGANYESQKEAVRGKVLSRNGSTRIFPGHGPITTVEEERAHNPFFV